MHLSVYKRVHRYHCITFFYKNFLLLDETTLTHIQTDKNKTHNKTIANSTLDTVEYGNGNINDNYSNYQITEENETNYYGLNCKKTSNGQHLR